MPGRGKERGEGTESAVVVYSKNERDGMLNEIQTEMGETEGVTPMGAEMFRAKLPEEPLEWCKLQSIEHLMRDKIVTCIQMHREPKPFEWTRDLLFGSKLKQGFGQLLLVKFSFDMIKRLNKVNNNRGFTWESGTKYVYKRFCTMDWNKGEYPELYLSDDYMREVNIMKLLMETRGGKKRPKFLNIPLAALVSTQYGNGLVLNFYPNRTLRHVLKNQTDMLRDKQQCLHWGLDFIAILKELQYWNIIHQDIKPANLCLKKWNRRTSVTLIDFGCALVAEGEVKATSGVVVTKFYRAPELWVKKSLYGQSVDEWAMTCVLWEVLCGASKPLFNGNGAGLPKVLGPPPPSWNVGPDKKTKSVFTTPAPVGKIRLEKDNVETMFANSPLGASQCEQAFQLFKMCFKWEPRDRTKLSTQSRNRLFSSVWEMRRREKTNELGKSERRRLKRKKKKRGQR